MQLVLYPALVQGEQAKYSIAEGIRMLDAVGVDVMIVGRGGGSIEDLWAFNEEMVARAIFDCSTPVISAVGHETDVTIADYVADLRAPTPSAAAELAVFDYLQFQREIEGYVSALRIGMERKLQQERARLEQYQFRLKLKDPVHELRVNRQRIAEFENGFRREMDERLKEARHRLALAAGRLKGLSPLEKISGGFGFLTDEQGKRIQSAGQVSPGDRISIQVRDGKILARVEKGWKI